MSHKSVGGGIKTSSVIKSFHFFSHFPFYCKMLKENKGNSLLLYKRNTFILCQSRTPAPRKQRSHWCQSSSLQFSGSSQGAAKQTSRPGVSPLPALENKRSSASFSLTGCRVHTVISTGQSGTCSADTGSGKSSGSICRSRYLQRIVQNLGCS